MKKNIKRIFLIMLIIPFLTACKPVKQMTYEGKYLDLIFNVKYSSDYRISQDKKDFRTAREEAIIISDNFKIGIEINKDLLKEEYNGDFEKYKENFKNSEDYKEVKYSKMKGIRIYNKSYARYEIYFPIEEKYILRFNVYAFTNNKKSTTKVLKSKDVKQILKYLDIKVK